MGSILALVSIWVVCDDDRPEDEVVTGRGLGVVCDESSIE